MSQADILLIRCYFGQRKTVYGQKSKIKWSISISQRFSSFSYTINKTLEKIIVFSEALNTHLMNNIRDLILYLGVNVIAIIWSKKWKNAQQKRGIPNNYANESRRTWKPVNE